MNVYEVVAKKLTHGYGSGARFTVDGVAQYLAPIIERGLRAAYRTGVMDAMKDAHGTSDNGVTAGVAAMVEEK